MKNFFRMAASQNVQIFMLHNFSTTEFMTNILKKINKFNMHFSERDCLNVSNFLMADSETFFFNSEESIS